MAHESGEEFRPYIAAEQNVPEFTVKAIVLGVLFGILFGAASYTPHVPPKPMVTLPPSTMTGTRRSPEMRTIRSSSFLFSLTLM
jgi:hypothetical protein